MKIIETWTGRMAPEQGRRPMWMVRIGSLTMNLCPPWIFRRDQYTLVEPLPQVVMLWSNSRANRQP